MRNIAYILLLGFGINIVTIGCGIPPLSKEWWLVSFGLWLMSLAFDIRYKIAK